MRACMMSSFAMPVWNYIIIGLTLLGIGGLLWLIIVNSTSPNPSDDTTGHVWDDDLTELNNPLPKWWVNLFVITIVFSVGYLLLYPGFGLNKMFLGWTQVKQYEAEIADAEARYGPQFERFMTTDIVELTKDRTAVATGRRLFLNYCATCHGSDGRGTRGFPNLADSDWLYGGTPAAIKTSILKGRTGLMPPWRVPLGGDAQVHEMAHYVRSLSGMPHERELAARAAPKFIPFCSGCHGPQGQGNRQLGAPNLTDDVWLNGGTHAAIAKVIGEGRTGRMPAHEEFLGEAKSHVLAAYVLWLAGNGQK